MKYLLLVLALGLGVLADVLFFDHQPGLSVPVFIAVLLGVIWFVDHRSHKRLDLEAGVWSAVSFLMASTWALFMNEAVLAVNTLGMLLFGALVVVKASGISPQVAGPFTPLRWFTRALPQAWFASVTQWPKWLPGMYLHERVWRAVAYSLAIGLVFALLLFSADPAFRAFLHDLLSAETIRRLVAHAWVIGLVGVVALMVLGAFGLSMHERDEHDTHHLSQTDYSLEWLSVLGTSNAVFALFLFVRFFKTMEAGSFIYSEVAREGFFSLIVAALCVTALLWARRFFTASAHMPWQQALETLFVAQTIAVLAGSVGRLNAYIAVYGLTGQRLLAWVALWLIGVWVLTLLVASLSKAVTSTHIWRVVAGSLAVAVLATTWANPEALMVKNTLNRSATLEQRDLFLLSYRIGIDGYSVAVWQKERELASSLVLPPGTQKNWSLNDTIIKRNVEQRLQQYHRDGSGWRSFNLSAFSLSQNCGRDWLESCSSPMPEVGDESCGPNNIYCIDRW